MSTLTHHTQSNSGNLHTRVTRHTDEDGSTFLLYLRSGAGTGSRVNVEVFCTRTELESVGRAIADILRDTEGLDVPPDVSGWPGEIRDDEPCDCKAGQGRQCNHCIGRAIADSYRD
jgi:hypothetical protein